MKINRKTAAAAAFSALLALYGATAAAAEPAATPSEEPTEQERTPAEETTPTAEPSPTGTAEPSAPADDDGGDDHSTADAHHGHENHDDGDRKTYGWEPSEYDTCPASLHDEYTVTGPDGKRYDSWHPTSAVDPATGKKCTHELFYAVRCSDGTEMAVTTLTPFGQPNEYIRNCTDEKVQTSGSDLPGANTGARRIPDEKCVNANVLNGPKTSDVWGLYELWESDTTIADPSGKTIARFDPWFGVRNPSRFASGGEAKPVSQLFDSATRTQGFRIQHRLRSSWNRCSRAELMPLVGLYSEPSRRTEPRQGSGAHAPEVPAGCR